MEGTISKWKGMARRSLKGRLGTAMLVTIAVGVKMIVLTCIRNDGYDKLL